MSDRVEITPAYPRAMVPAPPPPPEQGPEDDGINPRHAWNSIQRNKWLILLCILLVVSGVALFTQLATPIYQSQLSVRIDDKTSRDQNIRIGADYFLGSASQLTTEMEVLRSRAVASEVAQTLAFQFGVVQPERVSRGLLFTEISVDTSARSRTLVLTRGAGNRFAVSELGRTEPVGTATINVPFESDGVTFRMTKRVADYEVIRVQIRSFRSAVDRLRGMVRVNRPIRDANIVALQVQGPDAPMTRDIANHTASRYIALRNVVQTTQARSTAKFLREQIDTISAQLSASEDELRRFREVNQVVNLEAEASSGVTRYATLRAQRDEIETQRQGLTRALTEVRTAESSPGANDGASPYRRLLASPFLPANVATSTMFSSLIRYDDIRADLRSRRTADDPDVIQAVDRVEEIEGSIGTFARTYLEGLGRQAASIDTMLTQFGRDVTRIPAKEIDYVRLQRRPKVLETIFSALQARLKEAEIAEAVEDPSVRIIDPAILPLAPIRPQKQRNLAFGFIVGIILGLAAAFLRDRFDQAVHTREDVQAATGVPVLGFIPSIRKDAGVGAAAWLRRVGRHNGQKPALGPRARISAASSRERGIVTRLDPKNPVSEAYRGMRTNITFAKADDPVRTLVFTSPMPGDGKTTSAANLAVTLAQANLRVLLVDADLRRGMLNQVFGVLRDPGLTSVLLDPATFEASVRHVELDQAHTLDFLPSGPIPPNPAELLGSKRMSDLLILFESRYDMVIFDSPPLNLVTDAAILGSQVDGVLLVARAGATTPAALEFAMEQLKNVRAPILGTVLNDIDYARDVRYYDSYGSYGYSYYQYYYSHEARQFEKDEAAATRV